MIQANELRIGNWIIIDGVVQKVDRIGQDSLLESNGIELFYINHYRVDECSPISLTHGILEKAGFGIKSETKDEFGLIIENEGILIELSENYITEGRAVFYYNLPDTQTHKCIAYCKYLHQLQNFYYALTQTELNINL